MNWTAAFFISVSFLLVLWSIKGLLVDPIIEHLKRIEQSVLTIEMSMPTERDDGEPPFAAWHEEFERKRAAKKVTS